MELSSRKLTGLLADETRRRVVAAMILGATDLAAILSASGVDERGVMTALERLVSAGLVETSGDGTYLLLEQAFQLASRADAQADDDGAGVETSFPDRPRNQQIILDRCFEAGRLIHLPAKHSHRLVVLDQLVQRFEPGEKYSERQVNAMLSGDRVDNATLRRYLVDVGMLDRAGGEYWRSGGSVHLD